MTQLSVNINKIALLRNSRGHDVPNVLEFAKQLIKLGVRGITIHPRQDERHIKRQDARDLAVLLADYPQVEFNIEGYPSEHFLQLMAEVKPHQCTLVPDSPEQLTSDHGWDFAVQADLLCEVSQRLKESSACRVSAFSDPDAQQIRLASACGVDRIELYTEAYARAYGSADEQPVWALYQEAANTAQALGLGVNAGHDLNLDNLAKFLRIDGILEVSIGHALVVECIQRGVAEVVAAYLQICNS